MKTRYFWNKEKNILEEYQETPIVVLPNVIIPLDPFKKGLGKIRERFGSGGKKKGFQISPERKRK